MRVDEARAKRRTQERLKAARQVYGETQCLNGQGVERTVLVAKLDRLLHFVLARCNAWRELLQGAAAERRPGEPLKLLLFCDECQGGNVLNPVPWKKICFFHISLCEAPPRWRKSPHGWLPVAAVPYMLLQDIEGGHSRVTREVVAALSRFRENAIPLGNGQWATFKIHGFLSDMEGQRQVFASKGSAAPRPCLFCCNVVKHGIGLAELRNELVEISRADGTQLKKTSAREIFACCDHLSTEPWSTRRELERLEQTLGFVYQPAGLMFDRDLREHMSPDCILNDPLHCYFQGGVASWEAALLMNRLQSELGLGLESFARGVAAVRWQTSALHPQMLS